MRWRVLLLTALLAGTQAAPASAQSFFGRKKADKPNPADRVAQLVTTLRTDQDEAKRETAATELRQFDPKTYPEVIPVLIESLQNDPRPSVRMEAAQSLSRIRPISQQAGWALEQAASKDSSIRVRMQAKSSLLYYRVVGGYRSEGKPNEDQPATPPSPEQPSKGLKPVPVPPVPNTTRPGSSPPETAPPPLAAPPTPSKVPQPLPKGPKLEPVPPKPSGEGPDLTPPDKP